MEPRPALCCSHEFSITAPSHQNSFMMFLGCDISVEKTALGLELGFWGDEKIESDIIVIILPRDSVFLLPLQG